MVIGKTRCDTQKERGVINHKSNKNDHTRTNFCLQHFFYSPRQVEFLMTHGHLCKRHMMSEQRALATCNLLGRLVTEGGKFKVAFLPYTNNQKLVQVICLIMVGRGRFIVTFGFCTN